MGKKKLVHFQENLSFPHLFQHAFDELIPEFRLRSKWHETFFGNNNPLSLELGCGKGEYTVGLASMYPGRNFIGIDWKGARLWRGCKTAEELRLRNVAFIRTQVGQIETLFSPGEVSEIWITFPDPQVKKERLRLTAPVFLAKYGNILPPDGIIHLKTDDAFFFNFTIDVIGAHGHRLIEATDNLYAGSTHDELSIKTFYEGKWLGMGKKICYVKFQLCER